jgi:hypothetical protein
MSIKKDDSIVFDPSPLKAEYQGIHNRSVSVTIDESVISGDYGPGQDGQGLHMRLAESSISIDDMSQYSSFMMKEKEISKVEDEEDEYDSEEGEEE